ncbi:MAG: diaminopropionate ammonia-lyase [Proteocatella sp.]
MVNISELEYIKNSNLRNAEDTSDSLNFISDEIMRSVRVFHGKFAEYQVTPLHSLNELSKRLGVEKLWVKDESYRFGLNAFKVLGGAYAVGKYLSEKLDIDISELSFEDLKSSEIKSKLGNLTFVTATDGNHGRGIAWAASKLGQKSVIFMPKGSSVLRLENIKKEGAEASITDFNYDDTVRVASQYAKKNNGILIQDSSWEGYEKIPRWIMQGYCTLIDEAIEQIRSEGHERPTHVFLQAGVGAFAGGILGYLTSKFGNDRPITAIIEPEEAACIYKSAKVGDGRTHAVSGDMPTIMAGLACGEPSIVSWDILRDFANFYISCSDKLSARGMRILGNPLPGDPQIISGESGAVGIGVISKILEDDAYGKLADELQLTNDSKILIISTEGDTDSEGYRKIVWDGLFGV